MHFQGQELISRGTKATNRSLLFTSFAVLLLPFSKPTERGVVQLLSLEFPIGLVEFGAVALLVFLVISHLISWWGDVLSYRAWNVGTRSSPIRLQNDGSLLSNVDKAIDHFDLAAKQFDQLVESDHTKSDRLLATDFSTGIKHCRDALEFLEKMVEGIERLNAYAKFALFGWFLAVPLLIAAFAILVSLDVVQITGWFDLTPPVEAQESVTE